MPESYDLQYDEQGRPYYHMPGQSKNYVSPKAFGGEKPAGGNFFKHGPEWNQDKGKWDSNLNWGNILSLVAGGAIAAPAIAGAVGAAGAGAGAGAGGAGSAGAGAAGAGVAGSALPSTVIGTGMMPTVAGGTGLAGAAGTAGAAGGGGSVLSGVMKRAPQIASVLGGASGAAQEQKNFDSRNALDWERLKLQAPGERARTALSAALAKNYTPSAIKWGGPGSGLRGEIPTYSGGRPEAMSKALQDPTLQQMLQQALSGRSPVDEAQSRTSRSGGMDKALGAGSLIASLLSQYRR